MHIGADLIIPGDQGKQWTLPLPSPFSLLQVASISQKEACTSGVEEMTLIACIFAL